MLQVENVQMPDGTVVWARVESDSDTKGGIDAGLRDSLRLENLGSTITSVAASVHQSVAGLRARRVSVEFGVELTLQSSGIVAVLAAGGAKTSLNIRLDWELGDNRTVDSEG